MQRRKDGRRGKHHKAITNTQWAWPHTLSPASGLTSPLLVVIVACDEPQQHHPGDSEKCRMSGLISGLLHPSPPLNKMLQWYVNMNCIRSHREAIGNTPSSGCYQQLSAKWSDLILLEGRSHTAMAKTDHEGLLLLLAKLLWSPANLLASWLAHNHSKKTYSETMKSLN